jgi:polysaccharide biosynthesis protein PslJ
MTAVAAPARPRRRHLPDGWPVPLLLVAFPLWWVLGLAAVIWVILAVPMLAWLATQPRVRVPKGFGLWWAFLFWMLLSATQLDEARRMYAFGFRVVGFGFLALVMPNGEVPTLASKLLPGAVAANPFMQDLFGAKLAQVQTFIGYDLPRPAAPFTYTNEWGGTLAMLTPMALTSLSLLRSYLARNLVRLLLVASLVPIVVSSNRGLWVGVGVGLVYAAIRVALRGNTRSLVAIVGFLVLVGALVTLTPLERYYTDRLEHQHSNERRSDLGELAVRGALERPLLGYGGPRESPDLPNAPDLGTHGQLYLVMFSHGLPGIAFFIGWWLWALWASRRGATGPPLWCHVVLLIGVLEFFFYDMMPTQLHLMMLLAAVAWREEEAAQAAAAERRSLSMTEESLQTT